MSLNKVQLIGNVGKDPDVRYLDNGVAASSREGGRRYTYTTDIEKYLNERTLAEDYTMDLDEQMSEFVILGLRVINKGVDKSRFKELFNADFDVVFSDATDMVQPYVINTQNSLKLRKEAALVSNSIMCHFACDKWIICKFTKKLLTKWQYSVILPLLALQDLEC